MKTMLNLNQLNAFDWLHWQITMQCSGLVSVSLTCQCPKFLDDILIYSSTDCDRVMTANYGYFSSPNYPNNYPNNARCSYSISAPSGRQIVVRVHYYDIENEGSCRYDKLEIKAGNTILASLCGSNNNTVQYIARTNQVTALFRSDGSVTRRGFYASYYTIGGRGMLNILLLLLLLIKMNQNRRQ